MIQIHLNHMAESLTQVEQTLTKFGVTLQQDKQYKAMFICEEILTNLQRHGDFGERKPHVTLSVKLQEEDLELTFKDNSKTFNLLEFPDPDIHASLEARETGGLGIFLTKKYAKELAYHFDNTYNYLKVVL